MPKRERRAVADARESGDADRLYNALRAEADRQYEKMRRAKLTYFEIGLEIVTLDSIRRSNDA